MARTKLCRWNCGRKTDRRCGICIYCCDERDRQIASGAPYIPPSQRPGHRFYERKALSEAKKAALKKATAVRVAEFNDEIGQSGGKTMIIIDGQGSGKNEVR
jgi:hypothetical protein